MANNDYKIYRHHNGTQYYGLLMGGMRAESSDHAMQQLADLLAKGGHRQVEEDELFILSVGQGDALHVFKAKPSRVTFERITDR